METLMEEPSEDPPLDLEEYDDADHPINETISFEVYETVGMPKQSATRVWMIELKGTNFSDDHQEFLSEPIRNSINCPITISETRSPPMKRSKTIGVEETVGHQKHPSSEFRMLEGVDEDLSENNCKDQTEQITTQLERSYLPEDNRKIFSEINEKLDAVLPGAIMSYQDQPIKRLEAIKMQGTGVGKSSLIEASKVQGVDNLSEDKFVKAVAEFKAAFAALKPYSGIISNGQDSSTKGSDTPEIDLSEGNQQTLTELLKNALDAVRMYDRVGTISDDQNDSIKGTTELQETSGSQPQPIVNVRVAQMIEGEWSGDDCKALTEQLTTFALDSVRDRLGPNSTTQNRPINGQETTSTEERKAAKWWRRQNARKPEDIQVTNASFSEDNVKAVAELKAASGKCIRSLSKTVFNGRGSSTVSSDAVQEPSERQNPSSVDVWVTQLVQIDSSQVTNEEFRIAMGYLPRTNSNRHPRRRAWERRGNLFSTGMMIGVLATNVFAFAIGFGYGWWCRHALPTLSVYELHLDPTLF